MQLAKKWKARRGLPFQQDDDERKFSVRLDPLVERLVVFRHLPLADAGLADKQNESCCVSDFLGKLYGPRTARSQVCGSEEDA